MTEDTQEPPSLTERRWLTQWNLAPWKVVSIAQRAEFNGRWEHVYYSPGHITETVDLSIECATWADAPIPPLPDDDLPGGLEMIYAKLVGVHLKGDFVIRKATVSYLVPTGSSCK